MNTAANNTIWLRILLTIAAAALLAPNPAHAMLTVEQTDPQTQTPDDPAPTVHTADDTQQPHVAAVAPLPVQRSTRWAPMLVSYQRMNLLHPTLYYRSIQERREFPDAVARGCCGRLCSNVYEIVQFPVQLALTPLLMLINPPWQLEQAKP